MATNERRDGADKRADGAAADTSGRQVHAHIGSQLRQMFDEVVQEPIPDKLKRLLEDLEKSGANDEGLQKRGLPNAR